MASKETNQATPPGQIDRKHAGLLKLLLVLLVACVVRILWATQVEVVPLSDSNAYDSFARNLVRYGVFGWTASEPFAFWPPGTSFVYAAIYRLFGVEFVNIVIFNVAISAAIIVTSFRVALKFYSEKVALITAWTLALWPTLIFFTTVLASELPFLLLTTLALDVWSSSSERLVVKGAITGLLLGAAALVRPLAMALPIIFATSFWLYGRSGRFFAQLRSLVVSFVFMMIVILPWTWRNLQLYGEPVLISTNGGITLWMGNSPGTDGTYKDIPERVKQLPDNEQSRLLGAEALLYIRDAPIAFVTRTLYKIGKLYSNESIGIHWNADGIRERFGQNAISGLKLFSQLTWCAIFVFSVAGLLSCFLTEGVRALASPIVSTVAFYTIVHGVIVSQDRYHLAFASQLAMLAAIGLLKAIERARTWSSSS
jgi:4-amino-4-deoxy-L-arabinose transferase-like glycosyltransferase